MLIPVILAGGSGSRLWPLSRQTQPKQFIPLFNGKSLFQKTIERASSLTRCEHIIIVGAEQQRFVLSEQLLLCQEIKDLKIHILLEPYGRNTAPAILPAALLAKTLVEALSSDPVLLVLPADQLVDDGDLWQRSIGSAFELAQRDHLVTFGIKPYLPHTGHGYIQKQDQIDTLGYKVGAFKEKPDLVTARQYVDSGDYYWNSGMFCFKAGVLYRQMQQYALEMIMPIEAAFAKRHIASDFIRPDPEFYEGAPSDSIDYALMEHTPDAVVVPFEGFWSDVGAWDALADTQTKDSHENTCLGDTQVFNTHNCYVHAGHRLVALVGVDDLVVVETSDAVLVMNKQHAQEVKQVVNVLSQQNREEVLSPHRVSRPWGAYESIDQGDRFQVKRIMVNVGQRLSLQIHHHRSEHWVVVKGTARVTRDDEVFLLSENQSTYIPVGAVHRLENIGKIPLEIIEVQSGAYLGEDDIIRLEDAYGRQKAAKEKELTS